MKHLHIFIAMLVLSVVFSADSFAACTGPAGSKGTVVYNDDSNVPQYCNDIDWIAMGPINASASGAGCSNPSRDEGVVIYNDDSNVMQYCDSVNWIAMGPVPGAGGSGCSNPARGEGAMIYNDDASVMQYCDGATWRQIGRGSGGGGGGAGGPTWYSGITYNESADIGSLYCGSLTETALNNESTIGGPGRFAASTTGDFYIVADLGSVNAVDVIRYGGEICEDFGVDFGDCATVWNDPFNVVTLESSNNNSSWSTIGTLPDDYDDSALKNYSFTSVSARYFRLNFSSGTEGCTGQFRLGTL